jgi:Protein of unknown function (DUF1573)
MALLLFTLRPPKADVKILGAVAIAILVGCADDSSTLESDSFHQTSKSSAIPSSEIKVLRLVHDFGLVLPNSHSKHSFLISNNTAEPWTMLRVEKGCSCTTTSIATTVIQPNSASSVEIAYHAPKNSCDDARRVTISFNPDSAPVIELVVTANIRAPLTIMPAELDIGSISSTNEKSSYFIVQNYSEAPWDNVDVSSDSRWLTCRVDRKFKVDDRATPTDPLQQWRIGVTAKCDAVSVGHHTGIVRVRNIDPKAEMVDAAVSVHLVKTRPIFAVPSHIFFANVRPGNSYTRTLSIYVSEDIANRLGKEPVVSQEPPACLDVDCSKVAGRVRSLAVTLRADDKNKPTEGRLIVSFLDDVEPLIIPYQVVSD